ncbi:hypothetical protein [Marinobacter sp. X15-166B]|uniref:hypothetical protein n=1 Tax=Marinobacter sp. X15-166B TaxID=1897620 RepID=UPI00085BE390|nr:hypothetical protein [Marinobacter sp. X15-166B]OEY65998.1 hypothetical protein BG841_05690 [Marinobacter sp. X15-166B]
MKLNLTNEDSTDSKGNYMSNSSTAVRTAGAWFAVASLLLLAALIVHGPLAHDHGEQMKDIAGRALAWAAIHWISAASLSLFATAGLIALTSGSRLTVSASTLTAWAVLILSAIWTMTTAVAEATVVTDAAVAGNTEMFVTWWAFAEGKAAGIAFFALAVAAIAGNEAQCSERAVPAWSAWVATGAGVASFAGWALGRWFGMDFGNLLWVASSVLMSVWMIWFGYALTRSRGDAQQGASADAAKPRG